jgi:hypothetical protein
MNSLAEYMSSLYMLLLKSTFSWAGNRNTIKLVLLRIKHQTRKKYLKLTKETCGTIFISLEDPEISLDMYW